jgi:hypothetical protein
MEKKIISFYIKLWLHLTLKNIKNKKFKIENATLILYKKIISTSKFKAKMKKSNPKGDNVVNFF